ncbi:MAG: bifunctional diaminohydroxyphosphoribosylaminopyrimidine deaminase/5-amino-6-(5-phosphoribosylamino)uracil reductase RibD [Deltaproteobacteria bacterium]|nr:bifunctional diaminohydroxyphosphoribosylaminopyrimidine deaminase/5-amino-6-(5-phosphoribosylamino)uracil reductase RibD [Deltaproteobacteria bacterium]MBK8720088.1 bifunctional diaminohydroxyphosphoribosylaminopyrimidine deaminase/5-amino-6-(5-phosphoribosylamino)uracil reductase RibD [Deltaproteobacteria bacterium]MBP7292259.1 bifunctional diaminohydroxyphosphoribosylaminopyrimidine deaminase/5-amino-6-(5-phosphoribosylamino)uracil reductase RibD [Nannocystaceae bacterium]
MTRIDDAHAMARAVAAARRGTGATYPNPSVGAAIVHRGELVAVARSAATGGPHAEVRAIRRAGARARGATLFVTLEPCCHTGRTGPCTDAIIAAGIREVVVGVRDPAPHAAGKGIAKLRRAGVRVREGLAAELAAATHEHYIHHVVHRRPFVTLKAAVSVDGRIAVRTGDSKWISDEHARRDAHRLRAQHHGIAVGIGTVLADDPRLDVRLVAGVDPIAVVFDTNLRIATARPTPQVLRPGTLVLHGRRASASAREAVARAGAEPIAIATDARGRLDVAAALDVLGARELRSLLVEGGGALHGAFVAAAAWQRLVVYVAPRLLGQGPALVDGVGWERVADAPQLALESCQRRGDALRCSWLPAASTPAAAAPTKRARRARLR